MVIPEENMPYTKDGVRPDIIINPHAIPSRMTIGHLVECIFAKLCCIEGVLGDASVFIPIEQETIYSGLKDNNFNKYGNEILYNGYTGQQIETEIFIGPTYYFRLKHMVAEKINSRGVGKVMGLTRQPTEGRRKGGGLRIGEMERDTVLSHGISNFIKESMMERSDKFSWCICKRCGTLVSFNIKENINICKNCNNDDVAVIQTPYAFKLFIQELETMGIQPRLNTEDIDMPIDQAGLLRDDGEGDDRDSRDARDAGDVDADVDADVKDDDAKAVKADDDDKIEDIDPYTLFNSHIDNFTTKNTIIDEKVWVDTFSNHFDGANGAMKGGRDEEEENEEDEEDEDNEDTTSVDDEDDEDEDGGEADEDDEADDVSSSGGSGYEDDGNEVLWEDTDNMIGGEESNGSNDSNDSNGSNGSNGSNDSEADANNIKEIHITM